MEFRFYNPGKVSEDAIRSVTVSLRFQDGWLFVNHSDSYDLIEGEKTDNETPIQAGLRILKESFMIEPEGVQCICPYSENSTGSLNFGMLLFARINEDSFNLSARNLKLFQKLPECLTRGKITRRLFTGTQGWLNMQTNADELWDVYDENRNRTGRLHRRGDFLNEGDYHLVVHVWLLNSKGEFLLTKRAPNKGFPNTWETSGGAAQAGDDSLSAALREVREETGLIAKSENAKRIYTFKREDDFCDVWLIRQDFNINDVVLLDGETVDKRYVSIDELKVLYQSKDLIQYSYLEDFLSKIQGDHNGSNF